MSGDARHAADDLAADLRRAPAWDLYISLHTAAALAQLSYSTLRNATSSGRLRSVVLTGVADRHVLTTQRWLHQYLTSRNPAQLGRPHRPLPRDYRAPTADEPARAPYLDARSFLGYPRLAGISPHQVTLIANHQEEPP